MDTQRADIATNILVPIDGSFPSSRAIDFAATIGGPHATYTMLHVLPDASPAKENGTDGGVDRPPASRLAYDMLRAGGDRLRETLPGATPEIIVRYGDPALTIVREARLRDARLIVMASRGRESVDEQRLGSTVDRVVRSSMVPVLVVRERPGAVDGPTISRVVVPLDGSIRAQQALPVAGRLAKRLGVPVKLITVIDPKRSFPPSLSYEAAQTGALFKEILVGMQYELAFMQSHALKVLKRAGVEADADLLYGPTVPSIVDGIAPGDLMVMTSHGQQTGRHWLLGSVSEKLLREALLPMVLVRSHPESDVAVQAFDESLGLQPAWTEYR